MNGLYALKPWFVRRLRGTEDQLVALRVRPDTLTYAAVAVAAIAGAAIWLGSAWNAPLLWLLVAPLALLRIALNALDGSVARRTGSARPFGSALNEMCDRVADILLLAPLAFVARPAFSFAAIVATLLASYAGMVSASVAGVRDYGGPMGKADRMLVLGLTSLVAPAAPAAWSVAAVVIAAGAAATAAMRVVRIKERLDA